VVACSIREKYTNVLEKPAFYFERHRMCGITIQKTVILIVLGGYKCLKNLPGCRRVEVSSVAGTLPPTRINMCSQNTTKYRPAVDFV
jgi:hypothetical protein